MPNDVTATLQIKRGIFHIVLNLLNPDGSRKQKWVSTGLPVKNNKRAAEQVMRDLVADYRDRQIIYDSSMKFADLMSEWLESVHGKIRDSTYENYKLVVNAHIIPYFKERNIKAKDICPRHLEEYYKFKLQTLSPVTVQKHHANIHSALEYGRKNHVVNSNPAKDVDMRWNAKRKQTQADQFYTKEQIDKLVRLVKGDVIETPVTLIAQYGFRRSEVLGLKWDAVDFDRHEISVRAVLVYAGNELRYVEETKSERSKRTLIMAPEIEEYLLHVREYQEDMKALYGPDYHDGNYVCARDNGDPISPENLTKRFSNLLKRKGMPHIRLHDLRHSAASNLLAMGFPITDVSFWLGHANISTTVDTYGHFLKSKNTDIAKALAVSC